MTRCDLSISIMCSSTGRAEMLPWAQSHDKPDSEVGSNNYFYRIGPPPAPLEKLVPDFCRFKSGEN